MASAQIMMDAVRAAVSSTSTCSPATVTILNDLLLPKPITSDEVNLTTTHAKSKPTASSRLKATKSSGKAHPSHAKDQDNASSGGRLSTRERFTFATEIINLTLRTLGDAVKEPQPSIIRRNPSSKDLERTSARKTLRRSNSLPQSPLQPRCLNRVASSPSIANRLSRSSSSASLAPSGYRSIAECARVAFACLRALQTSRPTDSELAGTRIENGMSSLIGKLITLGLDDLAIKEIRILKRRLETLGTKLPPTKTTSSKAKTLIVTPEALARLLNFENMAFTEITLGLVITTQLQVLRLLSSSRNPRQVEAALLVLNPSHPSSPSALIIMASKHAKQPEKLARQLHALSDMLLSLCPSVSSADDDIALDVRSSVDPGTAFQLQTLALQTRVSWWDLACHEGNVAKEILDPFLRCLSAYSRRSQRGVLEKYQVAFSAFVDLQSRLSDSKFSDSQLAKRTFVGIYQSLGLLAQEADLLDEAIEITEKLQVLVNNQDYSHARRTSVLAQIVALKLRQPKRHYSTEELLLQLLQELDQPFKGGSSEIDDLLTNVFGARRAAITLLVPNKASNSCSNLADGVCQMCESLILMCPRLCLRYLGNPPDSTYTTKDLVRRESRRLFIAKSSLHAIDSVLYIIRLALAESRMTWEITDSKLQDCLKLLERLDLSPKDTSSDDGPAAPSYNVRISNLYYTQSLNMCRDASGSKGDEQQTRALRALRRSIDCVRSRPVHEKEMASLNTKLEKLAGLCKSLGRYDELLSTLLTLRDEMISGGVLTAVAAAAVHQPIQAAWSQSAAASSLANTIHSIARTQLRYLRSTSTHSIFKDIWTDEEKAAVLESLLELLLADQPNSTATLHELRAKVLERLLAIYHASQYPIRRIRVLTNLVSSNSEDRQQIIIVAQDELNNFLVKQDAIRGTMDEGLRGYLVHHQTLARVVLEVRKDQPDLEVFKRAVATWTSIRRRCESLESFEAEVEDVKCLLAHLNSVASFLQMKGFDTIRIAVLRLIVEINETSGLSVASDEIIECFTVLGAQWLHLGYSGKAGLAFDRAERYSHENGANSTTRQQLHLSFAEYFLAIGNVEKSEEHLHHVQAINAQYPSDGVEHKFSLLQRLQQTCLASQAYSVHSRVAIERGNPQLALSHAKQSVRLLRCAWTMTDQQLHRNSSSIDPKSQREIEKLADDISSLTMSTVSVITADQENLYASRGICFWMLVSPLFRRLFQLSEVYAHQGMFQETVYYAEQAHALVKETGSEGLLALASALLGKVWLKAGVLDKSSEFLMAAKELSNTFNESHNTVVLAELWGNMHGRLGNNVAELAAYEDAEEVLKRLTTLTCISEVEQSMELSNGLEDDLSRLTISKRRIAAPKKSKASIRKTAKVGAATKETQTPCTVQPVLGECPQMSSFKGRILRQKVQALLSMKSTTNASIILTKAQSFAQSPLDFVEQGLTMAEYLLFQSMEQMHKDPVYTVLQESTISFPSTITQGKVEKSTLDRVCTVRQSPPPKTQVFRKIRERVSSKVATADSFFDKLRQAHEQLLEVHPLAVQVAPLSVVHAISSLLSGVAMLMSVAGQGTSKSLSHLGLASTSTEVTRNLALQREHKSILADVQAKSKPNIRSWPSLARSDAKRPSLGLLSDPSRFQKDYIDIIPKSWTAISISLSHTGHELSISKLQAGQNPFILRLPLGRNNSIDADEEVFGFEQGRSELLKVIELANESAHDAREMKGRQAKTAWWKERETLNSRLRDLLDNIEKVWIGGFTGIFSQHSRRTDLLARFQKSFTNILNKHLPSRQKNAKRSTGPVVNLDPRILDLFIGLGDASDEMTDFSEPLTDLLYFVVDVLQFHGELNAYAEIDFDSIVIEIQDALRYYHEAAQCSSSSYEGRHTILILDKALHAFPWESLPCLDGLAVSRLPSLSCLRDRILRMDEDMPQDSPHGQYINRNSGTYVLNPSGDLKNTQTTFEKSLESLDEWHGVISSEPSEDRMIQDLSSQDLLLYFGHGSGAQYIRAREIKKLQKCSVTVLMGCSSGALTSVGDFEPYGPPINYMHAGCPALVATLWDVTDKDIDRFAMSTFEHWGLFQVEEDTKKGKGRKAKARTADDEGKSKMSLVEAVAKGKEACHLRYLNAAAVCVYGIPVYFRC